jgi:hypothetical protein
MNDNAWERLTDGIDIKLGIDRHGRDVRPLEDRPDLHEQVDFIEFTSDGQKMRLERATGPAILDRKSHYSHRAGTANRVENVYSDSETAHKVRLLKNEDGEWQEIDVSTLQL